MASRLVLRPNAMPRGLQPLRHAAQAKNFRFASTEAANAPASDISWPEYLRLRKQARRVGLIASVPTTILGFSLSASQFGTIEADPTATVLGVEQIWIYGLAVVGCTGLGWLVGPSIGGFLWKLSHRSKVPAMEAKERLFYQHIARMRADPSRQSVQNPAPDYYGEKIGSIKEYRQWLRDQAVFRRKAMFGGD